MIGEGLKDKHVEKNNFTYLQKKESIKDERHKKLYRDRKNEYYNF